MFAKHLKPEKVSVTILRIFSQLSAAVRIFLVMRLMVISGIILTITILGTEFTLMALGGKLILHLTQYKLRNKNNFTVSVKLKA